MGIHIDILFRAFTEGYGQSVGNLNLGVVLWFMILKIMCYFYVKDTVVIYFRGHLSFDPANPLSCDF